MQLAEYLNRAGLSQKEFVAQVRERGGRLAQPTLSLVMSGLRQPSFDTMVDIHNATNGEVSFTDIAGHRLVTSSNYVKSRRRRPKRVEETQVA